MTGLLGQLHMYGSSGWWMGIWMLIFWVLVIGGVVALARAGPRRNNENERARGVLAERYAAGEIDTAEFHTRSSELEKSAR